MYNVTNISSGLINVGTISIKPQKTKSVPDTLASEVLRLSAITPAPITYVYVADVAASTLSSIEVAALQAQIVTDSTWALRGTGVLNQRKRMTDLKNGLFRWNSTRWVTDAGRVLIYSLSAPLVSASSLTPSLLFPTVTIPGGLMGPKGRLEIFAELTLDGGFTPTARTINMTFGGSSIMNDSGQLHRRLVWCRHVQNTTEATQVIFQRANNEYTREISANTDPQTNNRNTANDQQLAGQADYTSPTTTTITMKQYDVWLAND